MGRATGQWEGDALVVDTTNFNAKTWLQGNGIPVSTEARMTERYQLQKNVLTLVVDVQFEDSSTSPAPLHRRHVYNRRDDWAIREYICSEANRDKVFGGSPPGWDHSKRRRVAAGLSRFSSVYQARRPAPPAPHR